MRPLDASVRSQLTWHLHSIEETMDADTVAFASPILPGLDRNLLDVIEAIGSKKETISVILDTPGGIVEVVERMVTTLRTNYRNVTVIVPDQAMSAGTIFALSADRIMMDYFSCLGPIDPQIERDDNLVPALSYLTQFERLNKKAEEGTLTTAEYALLVKLDLGELYQFEQARELSIELLVKWLSKYKFKGWHTTESRGKKVTDAMKEERARHIADLLNDTERWHSHERGIDIKTLREEVRLEIDDLSDTPELRSNVRLYCDLLRDYMIREKLYSVVHSKGVFLI